APPFVGIPWWPVRRAARRRRRPGIVRPQGQICGEGARASPMFYRTYTSGRFGGPLALQESLISAGSGTAPRGYPAAHYRQKSIFVGKVAPSPHPFTIVACR